jgi:hypothetical protein
MARRPVFRPPPTRQPTQKQKRKHDEQDTGNGRERRHWQKDAPASAEIEAGQPIGRPGARPRQGKGPGGARHRAAPGRLPGCGLAAVGLQGHRKADADLDPRFHGSQHRPRQRDRRGGRCWRPAPGFHADPSQEKFRLRHEGNHRGGHFHQAEAVGFGPRLDAGGASALPRRSRLLHRDGGA